MNFGPLYVITDTSLQTTYSHVDLVRAVIAGGADVVQFRFKGRAASAADHPDRGDDSRTRAVLGIARECGALCRRAHVPFIVNDRTDIAWAADADGVHLGDDDLPLSLARSLLGPHRILGASADSLADVVARAAEGADYCGVGPVFATSTKPDAGPVLGLDGLATVVKKSPIPLVAIGGISLDRIPMVAATGVHAFALVSAICAARNPEEATREARQLWVRSGGREQ